MAVHRERTFLLIKPESVKRGIVGHIIKRFENKGLKLVALKLVRPSEQLIKRQYSDLKSMPFFSDLVKYTSCGPVVPMVWEGLNAVKIGRQMLNGGNPDSPLPGSIRGDLCIKEEEHHRNLIHGSDSVDAANKELALWFTEKELIDYNHTVENWVNE